MQRADVSVDKQLRTDTGVNTSTRVSGIGQQGRADGSVSYKDGGAGCPHNSDGGEGIHKEAKT